MGSQSSAVQVSWGQQGPPSHLQGPLPISSSSLWVSTGLAGGPAPWVPGYGQPPAHTKKVERRKAPETWIQILALPLTCCVLGHVLNLPGPWFLYPCDSEEEVRCCAKDLLAVNTQ